MTKEELLSYDCICYVSGDGVGLDIINGYYQRKDIDFLKNKLTMMGIPAGSGNTLAEEVSK